MAFAVSVIQLMFEGSPKPKRRKAIPIDISSKMTVANWKKMAPPVCGLSGSDPKEQHGSPFDLLNFRTVKRVNVPGVWSLSRTSAFAKANARFP